MLKYRAGTHELYSFEDLNPSVIGHKIRWLSGHDNGNPHDERGGYFTVASYEEQSEEVHFGEEIRLIRKSIRITTPDKQRIEIKPSETFATNFEKYLTSNERYSPDMVLAEYTYDAVGADIVGNSVMVMTGVHSNHPWGDFITGRVISYKKSGATALAYYNEKSLMYEVLFEGLERPVVVDTFSSFWA
jgi:hypothetical protein